jgi:hypothetical protein
MKDDQKPIIKFLKGDRITLSAKQEEILLRWKSVDELMRLGKSQEDIITTIVDRYKVSAFTAQNDFYTAQSIFSELSRMDKSYLLGMHIEALRMDVITYRDLIFKDSRRPTEKEIAALSKLAENYTYALNSMPTSKKKDNVKPSIMMFGLVGGKEMQPPMDINEALAKADHKIQEAEVIKTKING